MLDYIAGDSRGDAVGPHADYGGPDFLGTFRRELSASSRAAVAAHIEDLRTTAYGPNFR
jgi:hypothetical protein